MTVDKNKLLSNKTKLFTVQTEVIVQLTTLVRAETAAEAEALARERKVESSWEKTAEDEGTLTHWLLGGVPGYVPKTNVVKAKTV